MEHYNGNYPYDPQPPWQEPVNKSMSVKDWVITLLILSIPCAGFIMRIIWAFSDDNLTRRNYCRASLLFIAIIAGIGFLLYFLLLFLVVATDILWWYY